MRWYVYHLVDPRDGSVFYVGKGTRSRVRAHEVEARRTQNTSPKCQRIRDIWAADLPVERRIVKLFEHSADALKFEAAEIARLPSLTNLCVPSPSGLQSLTERDAALMAHILRVARGDGEVRIAGLEKFTRPWRRIFETFERMGLAATTRAVIRQVARARGLEYVNGVFKPYGIVISGAP